jgi:hypothetical protein
MRRLHDFNRFGQRLQLQLDRDVRRLAELGDHVPSAQMVFVNP